MEAVRNLSPKAKTSLIVLTILIGSVLIVMAQRGFYKKPLQTDQTMKQPVNTSPTILGTVPEFTNEPIIAPNKTLEIHFNTPVENAGEFKVRMNPAIDFKTELSADRKVGKIIPQVPFTLGGFYTLVIQSDTKFDGSKQLDRDYEFKFRIVGYNGV